MCWRRIQLPHTPSIRPIHKHWAENISFFLVNTQWRPNNGTCFNQNLIERQPNERNSFFFYIHVNLKMYHVTQLFIWLVCKGAYGLRMLSINSQMIQTLAPFLRVNFFSFHSWCVLRMKKKTKNWSQICVPQYCSSWSIKIVWLFPLLRMAPVVVIPLFVQHACISVIIDNYLEFRNIRNKMYGMYLCVYCVTMVIQNPHN